MSLATQIFMCMVTTAAVLALVGVQVSDALSCSGGGTVTTPQTLTTGTHTVDNCVISAAITVTNAQLSITGGSSTTAGGKITVNGGATVSVDGSTLGADLEVDGGTATVTGTTFSGAGRVYGIGIGSTSVSVSGSTFADTGNVAAQVYCTFGGSGTHTWSITNNQFVGRGVVSLVSGTFSALTFSSNNLVQMTRVAGSITTAVTFGTVILPTASGVLQIASNQASSSTFDIASAGGLALLHLGSTTSSGTGPIVNVSANTGFAQIVSGAASLSTGDSCTNPVVFSGNTATLTGAPNTLLVFDLRTASMSGCPVLISGNVYSITHSDTGAASGLVALSAMPKDSSSAMTVHGNTFTATTKGIVHSTLFLISGSGSVDFEYLVIKGNVLDITTEGGSANGISIEDVDFGKVALS